MEWQTVSMGSARVAVPRPAIVHEIETPPDDVTAMRLVRSELEDGIACDLVLAARPWQHGWHVSSVVARFASSCEEDSVSVEPIDVPGAGVARRLDGTVLPEADQPDGDATESLTVVLTRSGDDQLVTLTVRIALDEREHAAGAIDRMVSSFTLDAGDAQAP